LTPAELAPQRRPQLHVDVTMRGPVLHELARKTAERVARLEHQTKGPLLHARVLLTQEENARIALRPAPGES
jgi:hypothetical protein